MAVTSALGPFRPGPGGMPPYLAGRESEQTLFRALLSDLAAGIPPAGEVILYGPRGNGKTVLLGWLEQETARFPGVQALRLTPSEIPDRRSLAEELLPESWWDRFTPEEVAAVGIKWRPGKDAPPSPRTVLSARVAKRPFVLLVDEAHTLELDVGRELLNASQLVGRGSPFLLVLAGTPDLEPRLGAMSASFWNRAEQVRIGRLDETAAAEAFRQPFEGAGIRVSGDALGAMVRESQGYPYFVQLLGRAIWRLAAPPEGRREVSPAMVEASLAEFGRTRGEYYAHRFRELARSGLLPTGLAVAEAFRGRKVLGWGELETAITSSFGGESDPERTAAAMDALRRLGYVWEPGPHPRWEPGIPSLMDYVREFAPAG